MPSLNKELIRQKYLPQILQSQTFQHSKISRDLLKFLVRSTLDNEVPKESTIAIQVFGKGVDFNSNEDPSVRVNISKLRQRLNDYYTNEGRNDKIRLALPKGHYEITFQSAGRFTSLVLSIVKHKLLVLFILTTLLLGLTSVYFWHRSQHVSHQIAANPYLHSIFWGDFISSSTPTNVVLSNQFVFREFLPQGRYNLVRNYWVNNEEELDTFRRSFPGRDVQAEPVLMQFDKNSIWGLQHITPVLSLNPHTFNFSASSELTPDDLKRTNILYLGSLVELYELRPFLEKAGVLFHDQPNELLIREVKSDSLISLEYYWTEDGFHNDYAIVAKLPGPNGKSIAVFAALNYMGNVATTRYFSEPSNLISLEENFLNSDGVIPKYFVVVFEATGLKRVEFELHMRYKWIVENGDRSWE